MLDLVESRYAYEYHKSRRAFIAISLIQFFIVLYLYIQIYIIGVYGDVNYTIAPMFKFVGLMFVICLAIGIISIGICNKFVIYRNRFKAKTSDIIIASLVLAISLLFLIASGSLSANYLMDWIANTFIQNDGDFLVVLGFLGVVMMSIPPTIMLSICIIWVKNISSLCYNEKKKKHMNDDCTRGKA